MHNPQTLHIDTIDSDWCDKDQVMLHACFQLLTDFVEKENINDITDWEWHEDHKTAKKEIDELYSWWKERIIKDAEGKVDPIWGEGQYDLDNEMLIRLVKVRKYLWT
jgi:hypothetical protein